MIVKCGEMKRKWTSKIYSLIENIRGYKKETRATISDIIKIEEPQIEKLFITSEIKILVIADTHQTLKTEELETLKELTYDICLLLGDIQWQELQMIKKYVDTSRLYGIIGNHDDLDMLEKLGINNIHNKLINVNGVNLIGWGGSYRYKRSIDLAFSDEESIEFAKTMPKADILISHDSPKFLHSTSDEAHGGLEGITYYLEQNKVPLNIHGHHHVNTKDILEWGSTSICIYRCAMVDNQGNVESIF